MSKDKRPWMKFFPRDWLIDAELRGCSLAAQGLWMQIMCLMYECDRRGVLETVGVAWGDEQIVSAIAGNSDVVRSCLRELLSRGVASRCGAGNSEDGDCPCRRVPCPSTDAIISRRMVRDEMLKQMSSEYGKRGGNPTLKGRVNPPLNPSLTSDICNLKPNSSSRKEKTLQRERVLALYELYPRHVGKKAALVAIGKALREVDYEVLKAAVERYAKSRAGEDPKFTPHPATWFNRGSWEDEPDAEPKSWTHEDETDEGKRTGADD